MRQRKEQHLSWRHSRRQHGALLPDTPWFLRRALVFPNPLLASSLILQSGSCWLTDCLCMPLWGWERRDLYLEHSHPLHHRHSISTSPVVAMPFWGAGLLFVFGKFTSERKHFSGVDICYLIKPGFSRTTKNIWRTVSVRRACVSFLMHTAYQHWAVKTQKTGRRGTESTSLQPDDWQKQCPERNV